ncbi:MAG: hypothetical protein WCH43_08335 [Verrucomicrobiota bacterium]
MAIFIGRDPATARVRAIAMATNLKQIAEAKLGAYFAPKVPEPTPVVTTRQPAPAEPPTPAPVESQPVAESTPPPSIPTPTPEDETPEQILTQLTAAAAERPQTVICKEAIEFPALMNGKVIGSVKIPPGTPLKLLGVQMYEITVGYLNSKQVIPASKSNLIAQVMAKRHSAQTIH